MLTEGRGNFGARQDIQGLGVACSLQPGHITPEAWLMSYEGLYISRFACPSNIFAVDDVWGIA